MTTAHRHQPLLAHTVATPGVIQCHDAESLLAALSSGGKQILAGQSLPELAAMLPLAHADDVLHLVAEGQLLFGDKIAATLANTLERRVRLTPASKPTLQLALTELLQNAIEHGNLGMGQTRSRHGQSLDAFTDYLGGLERNLGGPLGRIPVRLSCRAKGALLHLEIEDRGLGFKVRQVIDKKVNNATATGYGIGLIHRLLNGNLHYDAGGRVVRFSVPLLEPATTAKPLQLRLGVTMLALAGQASRQPLLERWLRQAGVTKLKVINSRREFIESAGSFQVLIIDAESPNFANLAYAVADLQRTHPTTPLLLVANQSAPSLATLALSYPHVDVWLSKENPEGLALRLERLLQQQANLRESTNLRSQQRHEIERTRVVQQEMLPSPSNLTTLAAKHNVQLAASYVGCETLAGDYWTIAEASTDLLAVGVMDFTGHGLRAAMNTVQLHALLKTEWYLADPLEIATHLNHQLHKLLGPGCFASYIYAVLNTKTGELKYCAGGSPPLLLKTRSGQVRELSGSGLPLGLKAAITPTLMQAQVQVGETLLLTSDAMTDAPHANGQRWGSPGLAEAWRKIPAALPARTALEALLTTFHTTVQLPVPDDLTTVIIKRP